MGMLAKASTAHEEPAKEKHKKENKHKAKVPKNASEGDEVSNADAPTGGPALDDDSQEGAEEQQGDSQDGSPSAQPEDAESDGGDDAGASASPPQQDQGSPGQSPDDQGDQGDPSGEAGDAAQGGGADQDAAPASGDPQDASAAPSGQGVPDGHIDLSQIKWPDGMKREYAKMNGALMTALYKNDKVAHAVISGIVPQGVHKIESVVHMSLTLFFQINKQLQFLKDAKQLAMPFLQQVVSHVLDLAMQVKKIQFSEQEQNMALSAAQEMLLRIHGVTKANMKAVASHIPEAQLKDAADKYQAHAKASHGITGRFAQGAQGQQSPGNQAPQQGAQPANGAAPAAGGAGAQGPSGGAGGTPGGQPQAGAPVTAAPGPGQSAPPGGMLTAAASQPPGQ